MSKEWIKVGPEHSSMDMRREDVSRLYRKCKLMAKVLTDAVNEADQDLREDLLAQLDQTVKNRKIYREALLR